MNRFAHIFIGKEFEQMVSDIGRVTYKYSDSAESYLNYYLLDIDSSQPSLKRLSISSTTTTPELSSLDEYIKLEWVNENIEGKPLSEVYRLNIFSAVLGGINHGAQSCLYVCLHFPFYKRKAFESLTTLYQAIRATQTPNKISFIGYCSDLAEMIEPSASTQKQLAPTEQVEAFKAFRERCSLPINHRLTLFQNAFQNGIPLDLDRDSLVDVVAQLITIYVEYYDDLYPDTAASADASSFGLSSIALDKYRFVEYLLQRSLLHEMDRAAVMNSEISINEVFDQVRSLLRNKDRVLSEYLNKMNSLSRDDWSIVKAEQFIDSEANAIFDKCEKIYSSNRSMPMYTALLAALLQTKCDLFKQMVFDPASPDINDLFVEPIDYFITHDKTHMLWENEETPLVNPVKEMKSLNLQLLNSDSQIKDLESKLQSYEAELTKTEMVDTVTPLNGDGFFHLGGDRSYKLIPRLKEEALAETYQPHDVKATSLDMRSNFAPIKDQGALGSCLAFALTSVFEYVMRSANRTKEFDLSERFLYYNARMLGSESGEVKGIEGSRFKPAIESLLQYGIASEEFCVYIKEGADEKPSDAAYNDAKKRILKRALNVPCNVNAIKSALEDGYPVVGNFTLCQSFANINHGFVPMPDEDEIAEAKKSEENSAHAMTIVGFEDKLQCFLVRNSWGKGWGSAGYCYIPYSYVENETLFNFACVLTEIESVLPADKPKEIAALKLDDGDVNIRYYSTVAALRKEQTVASRTKEARYDLSKKFEELKQRLSNHNNCEDYIQLTCAKTAEEQEELREEIKREKELQNKEYDEYVAFRKQLTKQTILYSVGLWLVVFLYNRLIKYLMSLPWMEKLVDFVDNAVETCAVFIHNLFSNNHITSVSYDVDLIVDWIQYVIIAIIVGVALFRGHRQWRQWRDSRDAHDERIRALNRNIAAKQKEIDEFRFKTQVACKWIGALDRIQTKLQQCYSNMTSRLNNLRAWHAELSDSVQNVDLASHIPNTSVLDRKLLDKFFELHLQNKEDFSIDFMDNIQQHEISENYLGEYQKELRNQVVIQLMSEPCLKDFDMASHMATDKYVDMIKPITLSPSEGAISVDDAKRRSDIFMHVRPTGRGVIMPSTYLFAPNCQQYERQLRQKIGPGMDSYLPCSNRDRVTFLQIVNLYFDECVMFQS